MKALAGIGVALAGIGVPNMLLDLIKELRHDTTSRVRLGNRFSTRFLTFSGVLNTSSLLLCDGLYNELGNSS